MSSVTSSSSSSSTSTPKPKLDLFHDSPRLVAKKCRTSTPSLRPPKPPTKSSSSSRQRCRPNVGLLEPNNHHLHNNLNNHNYLNHNNHNLSLQHPTAGFRQSKQFIPSRRLNNSNSSYFYDTHHDSTPLTPTAYRKPALSRHNEASFSFGLRDNSILEQQQDDEHDMDISRLSKQFDIISKIGSGNFGDVYKVKSKKEKDKYFAIKRTLMPFTSESDRKRKFQEVENHQMLPPHENCVKYYDSWEEDGYLYIQTELCRSNLNEIIDASDEHILPEYKVWKYLINLLSAVKHLHDNNLLHLDIKPDNIFISFDDKAKLGDFGLMCNYSDLNSSHSVSIESHSFRPDADDSGILNKSFNSSTMVNFIDTSSLDSIEEGDSKYLASEAMQGKFTKAADIYSLGITMFEAASGMDLPQRGETYHKLRQNQIDELYFNGLSEDLVKIIKLMMEADYSKRPLVDELLQLDVVRARRSNINYL